MNVILRMIKVSLGRNSCQILKHMFVLIILEITFPSFIREEVFYDLLLLFFPDDNIRVHLLRQVLLKVFSYFLIACKFCV